MDKKIKNKSYTCETVCESDECRFLDYFNSLFVKEGKEDREAIFQALTEDVQWEMVGDESYSGIEEVKKSFERTPEMEDLTMDHLVVERIYADRQGGVSSGYGIMSDGLKYRFADVVTFSPEELKISALSAFMVAVDEEETSR